MDRVGLLLINLGTPEAPRTPEVRRYLREFLSDPRVLDLPALWRWLALHILILPVRPRRSAAQYAKVWMKEGSPLLVHGRALAEKVRRRLADRAAVEIAMRYGEPSIPAALERFSRQAIRRIVVFPLYPQRSSAATGSSLEKVFHEASRQRNVPALLVVPPFYDDRRFLSCFAENAAPCLREVDPELVFFSFHGLPERQIRKSDRSGSTCLAAPDCCAEAAARRPDVLGDCYRAQCYLTARLLAEELGVPAERRVVSFQSRLGRTPWIRPFSDVEIREAARRGVKRVVVLSPAFVADCLETLEEIAIRADEDFRANGGEILRLVPSLNAGDSWADAVVEIARSASTWLR